MSGALVPDNHADDPPPNDFPVDRRPPCVQWTAGVARGDREAFAEFYECWFDRVLAMARSLSHRDESFCLDVVQDTMLRVIKSMKEMRTERAVAAWMARAVHSATVDRVRSEDRRRRRETRVAEQNPECADGDPSAVMLADEQRDWVHAELQQLPEEDRQLILARFAGEMTLAEVGAAFNISGNKVHGRVWRAVQRLKRAAQEWSRG